MKKLTITVDDEVYAGLHSVIGPRRISRFLNNLARPHVTKQNLDAAYREMAADEEGEREALEWAEELIGDIADESLRTRHGGARCGGSALSIRRWVVKFARRDLPSSSAMIHRTER